MSKVQLTTSPCLFTVNFFISFVNSYPSGAFNSEISYSPASKSSSFPSFLEVKVISLPLSKPSVQTNFISAPSKPSPVLESTFLNTSLPVVLESLTSHLTI